MEYITNGSFEQIDSCYGNYAPTGLDVFEWSGCKGWSNPIKSSSDLWCENPKTGNTTPPFIPAAGYQYSRTGENHAGFLIGGGTFYANYREYIQNHLTQPLKKNKAYNIEFYLSKGVMPCTTNKIGVKFFNTKYIDITSYWLTNLQPDANNDSLNFITDTLGWQKVSMQYQANGTENFVVIGCFADSLHLTLEANGCDTSGNGVPYVFGVGYYFVDDVSIPEADQQMSNIPNVITPNNDAVNDLWSCDFSNYDNVNCIIYNRWGNIVFNSSTNIIQWNGKTTSGNNCEEGIYFYCIETETEKFKGHIQLMR